MSPGLESPTAPAQHGWRWPAEWEPHVATWFTWPHNPDTWPGCLDGARRAFVAMTAVLQGRERVCILVNDAAHEAGARDELSAAGVDPDRGVAFHPVPTDDGWLRDCGPVWLLRGAESAVVDFPFDAWGRKYPPWDRDAAVPAVLAERLGLPRFRASRVLEGGAVDGDGRGTILTTESCLLNPNRGPGRTRDALEQLLADTLGARQVVWLGDGIAGDDTDGHVDDFARFVAPGVVVLAQEPDAGDANHAPLAAAWERLRGLRDADGKPVDVVALPMPPPLQAMGERLPASYANFYLANGVALVPTFEAASDERALAVLREVLVGREVVGVPCRDLVVGLGSLHCVAQQQPAPGPAAD